MFKIKVVGGCIRGLALESGKNENLRPTKDRIKESLFDILNFDIQDKVFLDLFGGTGQIGIEAFSRGAREVIIVEMKKSNANIIKNNLSKIKNENNIKFFQCNALDFLRCNHFDIDIAFIDPPYSQINLLKNSLDMTAKLMKSDGIIITETLSSQNVQNKVRDFSLQRRYNYGNISLNLYKKQETC